MSSPRIAVGVDIGGTKVLGALVDETGAVLREHRVPSPDPWPDMRDAIVGVINVLRDGEPGVRAVGVGAAGMIDLDGVIHYAPNVPGFRRVPVQATLAEATGLPTIVDNDANVAAYGETQGGRGAGLARRARDHARDRDRRGRDRRGEGAARGATASPQRSATSRSTRTGRCVPAGSAATGRRWRRAMRSAAWRAKPGRPVTHRSILALANGQRRRDRRPPRERGSPSR